MTRFLSAACGTAWRALAVALVSIGAATPCRAVVEHRPGPMKDLLGAYLDFAIADDEKALGRAVAAAADSSFLALEEALLAGRRNDHAMLLLKAERAVELDPGNLQAHALLARAHFRLADAGLGREEHVARAMEHGEAAIRLGARDGELFHALAAAFDRAAREAQARGDAVAARRALGRERDILLDWDARTHHPRAVDLLRDLAEETGDVPLEARCLRTLLHRDPGDAALVQQLGEVLRRLERCEEAIELLRPLLSAKGLDEVAAISVRVSFGLCAVEAGQAAEAEQALRDALAQDPTNLRAATALAETLLRLGRTDEALRAWDDVGRTMTQRDQADPAPGRRDTVTRRADYLLARARWEGGNDRLEPALAHAREALTLVTEARQRDEATLAEVRELVADLLTEVGRPAEAAELARSWLLADHGSDVAAHALADALWASGRNAEAEATMDEHARRIPRDLARLLRRARWELAHGNPTRAGFAARQAQDVARSMDAGPDRRLQIELSIAELLIGAGMPAEAEALLRGIVEPDASQVRAVLLLAAAHSAQGRPADVEATLALLDGPFAGDPYALEERARWEADAGLRDAAATHARRALQLAEERDLGGEPGRARFEGLLGEVLVDVRENAAARQVLLRALARPGQHPRSRHLALALALERTRDVEGARAALERATAELPGDLGLRLELGRVLLRLGRVADGVGLMRAACDAAPWRPSLLRRAGLLLVEGGAPEEGRAVLTAALQRFPQDVATWEVSGAAWEKQGDVARAEADFRKALEIAPTSASAHNALGYFLADRGLKLDEAVRLLDRAVELQPHEASYLDSLGWAHHRQGRLEKAAALLQAAVARQRDPVIVMHLATVRERQGRAAEALALYREALRFGLAEDLARVESRVAELAARLEP